jgi:hypothetical protein
MGGGYIMSTVLLRSFAFVVCLVQYTRILLTGGARARTTLSRRLLNNAED